MPSSFKVKWVQLIMLLLTQSAAEYTMAMPATCQHTSALKILPSLVIPSRVYGPKDRRAELTHQLAKKMGFSNLEQKQISKMIGSLYCPPERGLPQSVGTAFPMGSNNEIHTAGHLVMGDNGIKRDLTKCIFMNFDNPRTRFEIDANAKSNHWPIWGSDVGNGGYDKAKFKLKKAVTGAPPFKADPNAADLPANYELLMFSSQHQDFESTGNRPVISLCSKSDREEFGSGAIQLKTDCDSSAVDPVPPSSRRNGVLVVEGMNLAQGNKFAEPNAEYDSKTNHQRGMSVIGTGI